LLIYVISLSFYKLVAKKPLSSYFSKTTKVINRNYYKLSCSPEGKDYFNEFLSDSYVAIGWPQIGDLSYLIGKPEHDIREAVRQKLETTYPDMNNTHIGQVAGFFYKLLSMKPGDVLVLPGKNQIFICQVAAGYKYHSTKNPTSHRIKIDTKTGVMIPLNGSIPMTPRFKRVAQNRLTLISMDDYSEQIEDLIS